MNLIPCKLIAIPYAPRVIEAGIILKNKSDNGCRILVESDIINNVGFKAGEMEPVLLYLGVSQPMTDYYFRDTYIEKVFPPNRPIVRRVTQEVVNQWMFANDKHFVDKYFKVIAKPEVIGAIFLNSKKGAEGQVLTDYSIMTAQYIEKILNNNGNCFVQVKYPIRDSEEYILCFVNDKVIIHLEEPKN